MPRTNNTKYRIEQLEKKHDEMCLRIEKLDDKLDKIMQNHLPHIEVALTKLETRVTVGMAVNFGAIVLALAIQRWIGI